MNLFRFLVIINHALLKAISVASGKHANSFLGTEVDVSLSQLQMFLSDVHQFILLPTFLDSFHALINTGHCKIFQ